MDHADGRTVVVDERDQGGVQRHALREGFRAVDRVDDPPPPGAAFDVVVLLADDPVTGMRRGKSLPDARFGGEVGGGHRRTIPLVFYGQCGALEPRERAGAGVLGEFDREREIGRIGGGAAHGSVSSGAVVRSRTRWWIQSSISIQRSISQALISSSSVGTVDRGCRTA